MPIKDITSIKNISKDNGTHLFEIFYAINCKQS